MRPYAYNNYEMTLVYNDNIVIVSNLGDQVARQIDEFYKIKKGSQGLPTRYLGADMGNIYTKYWGEIWKKLSRSYITNTIETVEGLLLGDGKCQVLKYNAINPLT